MSKYIDADKIIDKLEEEYRLEHYSDYIDGRNDMINKAKLMLAEALITDVIEAVRCKDCHFYDKENNGGLKKHGFCEIYKGFKTDDGFCDLGEREEDE